MNLNDSSAAKAGALVVSFIASATAALRQFTIYSATTFSSVISGAFGIVKNGPGTLTLIASNAYTGGTFVNAGTLQLGNGTNISANVAGTTTLNGGNLAYNLNNNNFGVSGAITLTAASTITKVNGLRQINLQSGTLNGGGQTLNIYVDTTAGTAPLYFNGTAGTSLGQINILSGGVGQDGTGGLPLRNAAINISNGAQFRTYTSPTINNNITLNGGAGPDGNGALWNESVVAAHTPIYSGIITLASATNSSVGNTTSALWITGKITGAGSFTKVGTGILSTFSSLTIVNDYTGSTTISAGTLRVVKPFGAITPTASFTATTLSVSFSGTPTAGMTFRFFQGTTTNTYAAVTLVGATGRTGTYNSANSTLTIA
jgi:autotransporter-associated beta strand protein